MPATVNELAELAVIIVAQYYVPDHPKALGVAMANFWIEHLEGYPVWVVKRAISWWVGKDNPKRDKRPLPGDIAERCDVELRHVNFAINQVRLWDVHKGDYPAFLQKSRDKT